MSAAAVRKRLRADGEDLVVAGFARRCEAGDDGGHDRWMLAASLVRSWAAERGGVGAAEVDETAARQAEALEMARREVSVLEVELERQKAAALAAENDRLLAENASLGAELARLRHQLATLGNAVSALTSH